MRPKTQAPIVEQDPLPVGHAWEAVGVGLPTAAEYGGAGSTLRGMSDG